MSTIINDPAEQPTDTPNTPVARPTPATKPRRSFFKTGRKRDKSHRTLEKAIRTIEAVIVSDENNSDDARDADKLLIGNRKVAHHPEAVSPSSRGNSIRAARELMIANAAFYVRSHVEAVRRALELSKVDPRYIETARRASEFAIAQIGDGSDRIVDRKDAPALTQPTINIGIALGGMPADRRAITDGTNE